MRFLSLLHLLLHSYMRRSWVAGGYCVYTRLVQKKLLDKKRVLIRPTTDAGLVIRSRCRWGKCG